MEETEYSDPRHLSYIVKADREDASSLHPFSVTTPLRRNDLPFPNVYYPFGHTELERCLHVLGAYPAELARNDYGRALTGRAMAAAVLGGRAGLRVRELPALAPALRRGSAEVCRDRGGWRDPRPTCSMTRRSGRERATVTSRRGWRGGARVTCFEAEDSGQRRRQDRS